MSLTPEQALVYVQGRDLTVEGSNEERSLRQTEYLHKLIQQGLEKIKNDYFLALTIRKDIRKYLVSDFTLPEIIAAVHLLHSFKSGDISFYSLPGEGKTGVKYNEFHVDERAKETLMIGLLCWRKVFNLLDF